MPITPHAEMALRVESKVTQRGQTTIPTPVREALKLKPGEDRIAYEILPGGKVLISRQEEENEQDPVVSAFLAFLSHDMQQNPQHILPLSKALMDNVAELTAGMEVSLDDPLTEDDDE